MFITVDWNDSKFDWQLISTGDPVQTGDPVGSDRITTSPVEAVSVNHFTT